ncbi:Restriction endonuclease type II domain-containing protein [Desulfonema limicola]|uniref:Restriction endonuclease type II domain-containing protein n=1 Tax=Desulfonema limicola TaxID=45656 RepID=A0A975BAU9_9BACT|nr:DpnII family type II restriction endonuclease [Desulfonema limicola]QTA81963.1 Restriction endonuclease type II domain-containing protein [Desulfonema limicola]
MAKSVNEKFLTVIQKNTFYFFNPEFEESYESYINSLKETLLIVKNKIDTKGLKKEIFEWLLMDKENGLRALLALTGFSNEYLKRLTTIIRIIDNPELNRLVYKEKWCKDQKPENIHEWSDTTILKLIQKNEYFRKGLVNIFFEGASIPFLANTIPLFELKKLSISKLNFEIPELIDTLIRYKEKGSYSGKKGNNPETIISDILKKLGISFETGDLRELIDNAPDNKRTMDFIIPNKKNPIIIIESSFLATTSSSQGDKSKTEISIDTLIKEHYPKAKFIGFIDGIGWYVRKSDLKRMVTAYEDVFTFHKDELQRFEKLLIESFKK